MKHVLHVFGRMNRGGAEMRTLEVLRELGDDARFRFHFCILSGLEGELDQELRALGARLHYCRLGPGFVVRFLRLLRAERIDTVHAHVHHFSGVLLALAALAGRRRRIAHFRTTEDGRGDSVRRRLQRAFTRRLIDTFATDILAVSEGAMRAAWRPDARVDRRCRVIYNGVGSVDLSPAAAEKQRASVREALGVPPTAPVMLHVGRFDPEKNQIRVAEIFFEMAGRRPDAFLLLAGRCDTPGGAGFRMLLERKGNPENVRLLGVRADVPDLLLAGDVMLFPSLREGLPGAVLEATAAGLPVVGSDVPGVLEIGRVFPSVTSLPLEAENRTWAAVALARLAEYSDVRRRQDLRRSFRDGVFALPRAARALAEVWEGSAGA